MVLNKDGKGLFVVIGFIALVIYVIVIFILPKDYSRPTSEYYVNDYAHALSSASKDYYFDDTNFVYQYTKDLENTPGGMQTVIATYLVKDITETANYDKTDIYRKWQIGENDMGILILCFFTLENNELSFIECQTEVGYHMEPYLPAGIQNIILTENINCHYNYEVVIAKIYYELTDYALEKGYNFDDEFDFDLDNFENQLINYEGEAYSESMPLDNISYMFSQYPSFWDRFGGIIIIIGVFLTGQVLSLTVGGGGSSGGMGIRKKR